MGDFYITLQSDSSSNHSEENTMSNFRNYLAIPIKLEHESYEVAMVECTYNHSSAFVLKDELLYTLNLQGSDGRGGKKIKQIQGIANKDCFNVGQLLEMMNKG